MTEENTITLEELEQLEENLKFAITSDEDYEKIADVFDENE